MLVVQRLETGLPENAVVIGVGQINHVMPQLVFQARAKQFNLPKVAQPNHQAFIGNVEFLHLHPGSLLN
jgi:hypothetical protein